MADRDLSRSRSRRINLWIESIVARRQNGLVSATDRLRPQTTRLSGGQGHDLLTGSADRDTLLGGSVNDTLLGGADADILLGNDTLDGEGHSRDTINGGSGTNTLLGLAAEIDLAFTLIPD